MDKLKYIKLENEDGSYSNSIPLAVDAKDVDMANGKELQETIGTININTDGNIAYQLDNLKNNKVNKIDIIDNLNSTESNKVLSANQGKVLGDTITVLNESVKKKPYYYNIVADMKADLKLKVGDMAITLGYHTKNDGKGAFYKIRTITSEDVVDGVNIIALNISNTLIAEKIHNYYINELNEKVNTNTQNISNNSKEIDILKNRKYIFFGDSYASGEIGTSWLNNIVNYLGLSSTDYFNASRNGYGFTYPSLTNNWETVLDYAITQISNKNDYTDILVAGGYNDGAPYNSSTQQDIENAIQSFVTKCKNNFPNAKITIAHIGWSGNMDNFEGLRKSIKAYKNCTNFGASYINNSEFVMHNYTLYKSDYIHPNEDGTKNIAKYLINGLLTGSCDVYYEVPITLSNLTSIQLQNYQVVSITHNEISSIEFRNTDKNNVFIQSNNDNNVPLTQYVRSELFGIGNNLSTCYAGNNVNNVYDSNTQLINCYYQDTENNSGILPILVNVNNYKFQFINLDNTKNIKFIGIPSFSIKQLSLYC